MKRGTDVAVLVFRVLDLGAHLNGLEPRVFHYLLDCAP